MFTVLSADGIYQIHDPAFGCDMLDLSHPDFDKSSWMGVVLRYILHRAKVIGQKCLTMYAREFLTFTSLHVISCKMKYDMSPGLQVK